MSRDPFESRRGRTDPLWVTTPTDSWSTVMPGQRHPSEQADLRAAAEEWIRRYRDEGISRGIYRATPDGVEFVGGEMVDAPRPPRRRAAPPGSPAPVSPIPISSAPTSPVPVPLPAGEAYGRGAGRAAPVNGSARGRPDRDDDRWERDERRYGGRATPAREPVGRGTTDRDMGRRRPGPPPGDPREAVRDFPSRDRRPRTPDRREMISGELGPGPVRGREIESRRPGRRDGDPRDQRAVEALRDPYDESWPARDPDRRDSKPRDGGGDRRRAIDPRMSDPRRADRRGLEPTGGARAVSRPDADPRDFDPRDFDSGDFDPRGFDSRGFDGRAPAGGHGGPGGRGYDPRAIEPRLAPRGPDPRDADPRDLDRRGAGRRRGDPRDPRPRDADHDDFEGDTFGRDDFGRDRFERDDFGRDEFRPGERIRDVGGRGAAPRGADPRDRVPRGNGTPRNGNGMSRNGHDGVPPMVAWDAGGSATGRARPVTPAGPYPPTYAGPDRRPAELDRRPADLDRRPAEPDRHAVEPDRRPVTPEPADAQAPASPGYGALLAQAGLAGSTPLDPGPLDTDRAGNRPERDMFAPARPVSPAADPAAQPTRRSEPPRPPERPDRSADDRHTGADDDAGWFDAKADVESLAGSGPAAPTSSAPGSPVPVSSTPVSPAVSDLASALSASADYDAPGSSTTATAPPSRAEPTASASASASDDPGEPVPQAPAGPPDPERQLAAYNWRYHFDTLRELVEDPDELRDIRERLTEKLDRVNDNASRARLLSLRAVVSRLLGDLDKALADGKLALVHAEATGELRRVSIAQARLAHVHQWRQEYAEADRLYELANSSELPDRLRATMHEQAARCAYDQSRFMEACNHLDKALELRKVDDPDLIHRIEMALDAIFAKVLLNGWGPYPRTREEILRIRRAPTPAFDERSKLWGYVGPGGEPAIAPAFAEVQPFAESLAWVRRPQFRGWELIDDSGQTLIDASARYIAVGSFSDGVAWVVREGTRVWIGIDRSNRIVIGDGFEDVRAFRRGLAAVRRGAWGAIDKGGLTVVPMRYLGIATALADGRYIEGFSDEGLAVIDTGGGKGVVDRAGRVLVEPRHPAIVIHPVAFLIADPSGQWGALDRRGRELIDVTHPSRGSVIDEIDRLLADTRPVL